MPHMLESLEMPENRTYSFPVLFPFEIHHVVFPRNGSTFICSKILKCLIFHMILKMGKWSISRNLPSFIIPVYDIEIGLISLQKMLNPFLLLLGYYFGEK